MASNTQQSTTTSNNNNQEGLPTLENPLEKAPSNITWHQQLELGYTEPKPLSKICFGCGKSPSETSNKKLSKCSKCSVAAYCSRDCQVQDWKIGRHKLACPSYSRAAKLVTTNNNNNNNNNNTEDDDDDENNKDNNKEKIEEIQKEIRNELFARVRFYACPYGVFRTKDLGRGFLFIQCNKSLKDMSLYVPKDMSGRTMNNNDTTSRSMLIHFLTIGEYDAEVCKEDFELALVRTKLKELVESYNIEKEVILLYKFRCGHMAVGKATLVPDYKLCQKLGQDYYAENPTGALHLKLDEM